MVGGGDSNGEGNNNLYSDNSFFFFQGYLSKAMFNRAQNLYLSGLLLPY